jgi:uncharacterized protein
MRPKRNETALITGASGGIGYEFSKILAADGYNLVLVARRREELQRVAKVLQEEYGVSAYVLPKDLAKPSAPWEVYNELKQERIEIDVLINNAGFGLYGPFEAEALSRELDMIQLNITALTHLTKLFLPDMIKKRSGKIMNVSSTAAFQPGPMMAIYYATKAYVLWFSEAISNELSGTGVSVTTLCPGPTKSDFQTAAGIDASNKLFKFSMDAESVARIGYKGMVAGKALVIPGTLNTLAAWATRLAPRALVLKIVRRLQDAKKNKEDAHAA